MNQVLASSAGNAVEVREAVQFLTGEYVNPRLHEVTMALCAEMLLLAGLAANEEEARIKLQAVLDNGKAAEVFGKMVSALGGPADFIENYNNYLETSEIIRPVYAPQSGIVQSMDTRALGMAIVNMGGGRKKSSDSIDYTVGLTHFISIGEEASSQRPLPMIHARSEAQFTETEQAIQRAIICGSEAPETEIQIYERIRFCGIN